MEYRRLGRTGIRVSTICLGTMQFGWTADEPASFAVMSRAVELGINFVDTADIYSRWAPGNAGGESETIIGNWLARSVVDRDSLVIATKVRGRMGLGPNEEGLSRVHIMRSVEQSLRRLQTDHIDLYQVHFPDDDTPLDETLEALDSLVSAGKVRYIGCSNYPAWLLAKSLWVSDLRRIARFDSLQPHYSYVHRTEFERELQPLCQDQAIGVIPYSPLAGGFLTGKYRRDGDLPDSARAGGVKKRYMNDRGFEAVEKLEEIGQDRGATIAQMAIAWVLANPTVSSAIIGANSVAQLEETVKGAEVALTPEEKQSLDEVTAWK
ncbi:MAG: aldo/keto reductase [Chloroflexota bacterium]|nr:MAG: aldo/keto reductase [Chloroflexota bacterium]